MVQSPSGKLREIKEKCVRGQVEEWRSWQVWAEKASQRPPGCQSSQEEEQSVRFSA